MERLGRMPVTDGVAQTDRLPAPLADGYFRVDERDFATLLASMADHAERIPFVNTADVTTGSWAELFHREDACVMASILAEPCTLHERRFADLRRRDPYAAVASVVDLAARIDAWLVRLRRPSTRAGADLGQRVASLVARLGPTLGDLVRLAQAAGVPLDGARDPARFDPTWRQTPRHGLGGDGPARLEAAFQEFIDGIRFLQGITPPFWDEAVHRADHEPALALLFTFLHLFGDVQGRLNGFTGRHNDFYYAEVLKTRPRPAAATRVALGLPDVDTRRAIAIPAGTPLTATTPDGRERIGFHAEADTFASRARLMALHTLHYERDPLISPQHELDFVTRVRETRLPVAAEAPGGAGSHALLGTTGGVHAAMGLVVTAPTLLLREGRRRVRLTLAFRPPRLAAAAERTPPDGLRAAFADFLEADPGLAAATVTTTPDALLDALMAVGSPATDGADLALLPAAPIYAAFLRRLMRVATPSAPRGFTAPFGRLVGRLLLGPDRALPAPVVDALVADADRVLGRRPPGEAVDEHPVRTLLTESRAYQYAKYLSDAFTLELTTAAGWFAVEDFGVAPLRDDGGRPGLEIGFELDAEAPAIVANAEAAAATGRAPVAPMARLRLAAGATLCAQTLLEPFRLDEVQIAVDVADLRALRLAGDLGPLDPSQPFQPFGPAPRLGASFVVGAYEAAIKNVERMVLKLDWTGLPREPGGFAAHYRDYGAAWATTPFAVELDWRTGGAWVPACLDRVPLFRSVTAAQRLPAETRIALDVPASARPLPPATPEADFATSGADRAGFARLRLTGPPDAFGHALYPVLFARTLGRGLTKRRAPPPINAPYTPTLAHLRLDYRAQTAIRIAEVPTDVAHARGEFVDHVGPFGVEEVHPEPIRPGTGPLPARAADGALHVGLADLAPGQPVSLLFAMAERAHRRRSYAPPAVTWSCLTARGWRMLDRGHLLADTTSGLMRSGVVSLAVPEDATTRGAGMPAGAIWLRVTADAGLDSFPRLAGVHVNGLTAVEEDPRGRPLPAALRWRFQPPIVGLEGLRPVGRASGGVPGESRDQYRARISERLRHRGRAVTTWDYERLVLERFPEVWKAKAFAALDDDRPAATTPGRVLVVVVPHGTTAGLDHLLERRMFDVLALRRIGDALAELAPAGAQVDVRNPAYDLIQVRCRIRFAATTDRGRRLRQLGERLAAYLSPWDARGGAAGFGWRFNVEDIQADIAQQADVAEVSACAMLMLTADDLGHYRLADTARADDRDRRRRRLVPSVPWSLPLPLRRQVPEPEGPRHRLAAAPVGVGDLDVGGTLVVTDGPQ